jgi:hypothetical protein
VAGNEREEPNGRERAEGQGAPAGREEPFGPQPSRGDKRLYFVLMAICIGLFILSWAVLDRYSVTAAIAVSAVALVIPPFAAIIANAASATDRRRR